MKLYLSSHGVGQHADALQELVGANKLAAVIVNAQDATSNESRLERLTYGLQEMNSLGFEAEELDLRDYFDKSHQLEKTLRRYGLVWVRGGNVFVLRRAMRQSGFDKLIHRLVTDRKIVYAGYSAGSCITAPSLRGFEIVDDHIVTPDGYDREVIWDGLNLIPYAIAPHYRSNHPESERVEELVAFFTTQSIDHRTLRDGQTIVVDTTQQGL